MAAWLDVENAGIQDSNEMPSMRWAEPDARYPYPLSDLLIGASALELGYGVGTANVRHFGLIPGLNVVQL